MMYDLVGGKDGSVRHVVVMTRILCYHLMIMNVHCNALLCGTETPTLNDVAPSPPSPRHRLRGT